MSHAKRAALTVVALLCFAATASADLKMTIHMEAKSDPAAQANPFLAAAAGLLKSMVPEGGVDVTSTVGEKGSRTEYSKAAFGQPAGTVSLALANGDMVVLNPAEKTYWKLAVQDVAAMMKESGMEPQVTTKLLDEYETIAGLRARKMTFDWKVALAIPEAIRAQLPPDMPKEISMAGDVWLAADEKLQKYAAFSLKTASSFLAAMGLDKIVGESVVLKQVARTNGVELTSVATSISEETVPASAYEIPEGYKEVPPPTAIR
jgi:hypothetical protein